jgi:hypothetical protein
VGGLLRDVAWHRLGRLRHATEVLIDEARPRVSVSKSPTIIIVAFSGT